MGRTQLSQRLSGSNFWCGFPPSVLDYAALKAARGLSMLTRN
jgi:hypothetical protein